MTLYQMNLNFSASKIIMSGINNPYKTPAYYEGREKGDNQNSLVNTNKVVIDNAEPRGLTQLYVMSLKISALANLVDMKWCYI